jgi:uncharacterized protein YutE (UPF0331/DUF86 family)
MELRVEALRGQSLDRQRFLDDWNLQTQVERHLQLAIQSAIDIAVHIVAEDSAKTPEDYSDTFRILAEMDVIGSDLSLRLGSAAKLRNILVHMYLEVDPQRVWEALGNLDDLESFAAAVERYLEKSA